MFCCSVVACPDNGTSKVEFIATSLMCGTSWIVDVLLMLYLHVDLLWPVVSTLVVYACFCIFPTHDIRCTHLWRQACLKAFLKIFHAQLSVQIQPRQCVLSDAIPGLWISDPSECTVANRLFTLHCTDGLVCWSKFRFCSLLKLEPAKARCTVGSWNPKKILS